MIYKEENIIKYLSSKIRSFKIDRRGSKVFTCPVCLCLSAQLLPPNNSSITCLKKNKTYSLIEVVRHLEEDKKEVGEEIILDYLKEINGSVDDIDTVFNFYVDNGFSMVPVESNGKKANIEKNWQNKEHRIKKEWYEWIKKGLNIGINCGKISNVLIIDIDMENIPPEINDIKGKPVIQKTNKGWHLFYKYDEDISNLRIHNNVYNIDVQSDGTQCVVFPSKVEGVERRFISKLELNKIPEKFKLWLLEQIKNKSNNKKVIKPLSSTDNLEIIINTEVDNFGGDNINIAGEGNRTNFLISLGGKIRRKESFKTTSEILSILNYQLCNPPLSRRELQNILSSLDNYLDIDVKELADKILDFLRLVDEAYAKEIAEGVNESSVKVAEALSYLIKEEKIVRSKRLYKIIRKLDWKNSYEEQRKLIDFKIPYFDDYVVTRDCDLILIGARPKVGKTSISINLIKQFIEQGIKPRYISAELGSRSIDIAIKQDIKAEDWWMAKAFNPKDIILENNAVTIYDWLLPEDYSQTDKIIRNLITQLDRKKGLLIVFVQLTDSGNFFARNMIPLFPALVATYHYVGDNPDIDEEYNLPLDGRSGQYGYFRLDYIREPKQGKEKHIIPCEYNVKTTQLLTFKEMHKNPEHHEDYEDYGEDVTGEF